MISDHDEDYASDHMVIWVINMIVVKIHKITSIEERLLSFPQLPPVCNVLLLLNEKEQDPNFLQKDSLDFLEACLDPTKNILHEGHLSLSLSLCERKQYCSQAFAQDQHIAVKIYKSSTDIGWYSG